MYQDRPFGLLIPIMNPTFGLISSTLHIAATLQVEYCKTGAVLLEHFLREGRTARFTRSPRAFRNSRVTCWYLSCCSFMRDSQWRLLRETSEGHHLQNVQFQRLEKTIFQLQGLAEGKLLKAATKCTGRRVNAKKKQL